MKLKDLIGEYVYGVDDRTHTDIRIVSGIITGGNENSDINPEIRNVPTVTIQQKKHQWTVRKDRIFLKKEDLIDYLTTLIRGNISTGMKIN